MRRLAAILALVLGLTLLAAPPASAAVAAPTENRASGSASAPNNLIGIEARLSDEAVRENAALCYDIASDDAVAARAITAETSLLARASEAAIRAAGRADEFALGAKHAAGAGGRWAKFAESVDANAALREALTSPGARILPNDANSFRVVTDLGRAVGSRGETGVRAVVDFEGHVVTWFPVRP